MLDGERAERRGAVLFSQYYGLDAGDATSWLDPALTIDTPLFLDPFLLEYTEEPEFQGAFEEVFRHFQALFVELARDRHANILDRLGFPEIPETCLGYSASGTRGAGAGAVAAHGIRDAMVTAISAGLMAPRHFEEIGLLSRGIAEDRVSDITTRLILPRLAAYTRRVASELGVPLRPYRLWFYAYRNGRSAPIPELFDLPLNPFSARAVLLVPKFLLRKLPTISTDSFQDYLWSFRAEELRRDFNIQAKRDIRSRTLEIARSNMQWVREYVASEEERGARPYPFSRDPSGYVRPYRTGYAWFQGLAVPRRVPANSEELGRFVAWLADEFKNQVELRNGWRSLWTEDGARSLPEAAAQRLFHGMARPASALVDVDVTPEANSGVGPVDFKFSRGHEVIVVLELKLVSNSRYWDGPAAQLPTYVASHDARNGFFVVIAHRDSHVRSPRWTGLGAAVARAANETGFRLEHRLVDARRRVSASRRRRSR